MTVMLYKKGGPHRIHGRMMDYCVVEKGEVKDLLATGEWFRRTSECFEEPKPKKSKAKTKLADMPLPAPKPKD